MNSQSLILLGVALFVGLVFTIVAVDYYLLAEHNPLEPGGLLWRVQTAFSRIKDLEAVLAVADGEGNDRLLRLLVRLKAEPDLALSVRYLEPESVRDELFTVSRDLLSHYLPQQNVVVIKRWVGLPLATLGLAGFDLSGLERDWRAGKVRLRVLREASGSSDDLSVSSLGVAESIGTWTQTGSQSADAVTAEAERASSSFAGIPEEAEQGSVQGRLILEATDAASGQLSRVIWVDRETFLVAKVTSFADGRRTSTISVERITLDQGLTEQDILAVPRGVETIRG
jgi:hypothetical protein